MKKTYVKPNTSMTAIQSAQLIMSSGSSLSTPENNNAPMLKVLVEEDDNSMAGGTVTSGSNAKPYAGWDTFEQED